jgi:heat shock protein HtpX
MATLYTYAESNTRKSFALIAFFLLLLIFLGWFFSYVLDSPIIIWIVSIFSILTSIGTYWFSDKIVISMTRARPIQKQDNPELYRLVENLCITAGLPLPKIYILNESQPNAFATGRDANHAIIAVTAGLLEKLGKTELEGVIAHELSHIGNKDMLLQTIIVVMAGIMAALSRTFLRIGLRGGGGNRKKGGLLLLALAVIAAILAPLAATLIRLAISRKREFLADATGALLTRYPEGLAQALEKISADPNILQVASPSTAHLFIASPFKTEEKKQWLTGLFMTHPPVEERIKALRDLKM